MFTSPSQSVPELAPALVSGYDGIEPNLKVLTVSTDACAFPERKREIFIDNLLVRVHLIIEMILVDRPCAMGV